MAASLSSASKRLPENSTMNKRAQSLDRVKRKRYPPILRATSSFRDLVKVHPPMPTVSVSAKREPSTEIVAPRKIKVLEVPRHRPVWASICYVVVAILVVSAFSSLAKGADPGPNSGHYPVIASLHAQGPLASSTFYVGQPVYFFANVSGGNTLGLNNSSSLLVFHTGYHLFWSFGPTSQSGLPASTVENAGPSSVCGNCSVPVAVNFTYKLPGSYVVSVTVYDGQLDFKIATIQINVVEPTFGVFIAAPCNSQNQSVGQVCATNGFPPMWVEEPIEFDAMATGIPLSGRSPNDGLLFQWNFGDGNTSYGASVFHTYAINATYMVSVTVTNLTSQVSARAFLYIAVQERSLGGICPAHPGSATAGIPVTMRLNLTDPNPYELPNLTVEWNFGDGTYGTGFNATHIYTATGTYYPFVQSIQGNHSKPIYVQCSVLAPINVTASSSVVGHRGVVLPVGQTAFLNESNYTNIARLAALTNSSWTAASGGSNGYEGRTVSYTVRNESVGLTVTNPYASTLTTSTTAQFTDVKPIVGVDGLYVNASVEVYIPNNSNMQSVDATIIEDGTQNLTWHRLLWPASDYYFPYRTFSLGHRYALELYYRGYGSSGGTTVYTYWYYQGTGATTYYITQQFTNSNPPNQQYANVSENYMSTSEPVFIHTDFFSPADTKICANWTMGDGTVFFGCTGAGPSGPTLDWALFNYNWAQGAWYNMSVKATDGYGAAGYANLTITDTYLLTANDTAPKVQAPYLTSRTTADGVPSVYYANLSSQMRSGNTGVLWQFGDGSTVKQSYLNANTSANVTKVFRYASQYLVVSYASSPNGSTSANFSLINVVMPTPTVSFVASNTHPNVYTLVTFNASRSRVNSWIGVGGLAFAWNFGDGVLAGGYGMPGAVVQHVYTVGGSYTATLTVQTAEGQVATTSQTIVVNATFPTVTFPSRTLTVDNFTLFHTSALAALADSPYVNALWTWGDGNTTLAFNPGHTYLVPGNYTASLTLSGPFAGSPITATGYVRALDDPQLVVYPYEQYGSTGENHTSPFTAYSLGSYADINHHVTAYAFTWQWGDGNTSVIPSSSNTETAYHDYNYTGNYALNLTVASPFTAPYQTSGTASTTLTSSPDCDGDGLPNAFEATVTHTFPCHADSQQPSLTYYGTGFTDYISEGAIANFGNLSADPDSDGLTTLQEISGSVTGFPSNPFDANTAGDGIPDGSHFISDSFRSDNVAPYGTTSTGVVNLTGVYYAGPAVAFHDASLFVQLNVTNSSTVDSTITVQLIDPWGDMFTLPALSQNTETIDLLNATPTLGQMPKVPGMTIGLFQKPGQWQVMASTANPYAVGSITEVNLALSYYTDPGHADPTHQGLLQGHGITTPILNCTQPSNANYTVFNPKTFQLSTVALHAWTEEYYKLSVVQGVPYVLSSSASVAASNYWGYNNSTSLCARLGVPSQLLGLTASYLGDADFGISPWNADVTGDSLNGTKITNGMKALGAAAYDATYDRYILWTSYGGTCGTVCTQHSQDAGYVSDPLTYQRALNPTVLSSQGDGVPDSFTMSRTHPSGTNPLALAVTISQASNDNNVCQINPSDAVGVDVVSMASDPGQLTPLVTDGTGCNSVFTFNDAYTLPLDNSQTSFQVRFTLYHQQDASPNQGSITSPTLALANGVSWSVGGLSTCGNNACFSVSVQVEALQRSPAVLVNNSGELTTLAGYGPRWAGEQQFYAFYLNINGSASQYPHSPFATGSSPVLNTLLISRTSYLSTNFSAALNRGNLQTNMSHVFWCLNGAQMSVRNGYTSQLGISGSLSASMNATCANELLQQLAIYNSTGNLTSAYQALNTTGIALLGLQVQDGQLAVFLPLAGFNSGGGTEDIKSLFGTILGIVESATSFIINAIIAFVNNPIGSLVALGQAILAAISAACPACAAAVSSAINTLNFLLGVLESAFRVAFNLLVSGLNSALSLLLAPIAIPFLSMLAGITWNGTAILNQTEYNGILSYMNIDPPLLTFAQGDQGFANVIGTVTATIVGLEIGWGIFQWFMTITSLGTAKLAKSILTTTFRQALVKSLPRAIELGVGLGVALGAAVVANSLSDSVLRNVLRVAGLSAGAIVAAIQLWDDISDLRKAQSYTGIVAKQQVGILMTLPFGILSDLMGLLGAGVQGYEQSSGDTHLHTAVFAISLVGVVLGVTGAYFALQLFWKVLELSLNIDPMAGLVGLVLCGLGAGTGIYSALTNPA